MIKEKLKLYGLTLSAFSERLNISRPTLDNYIRLYENGLELPNKKFSSLFNTLFGSNDLTISEFHEKLERFTYLLTRDNTLGISGLDMQSSDLLSNIIDISRRDLYREDHDIRLYQFITMLLNNYYQVPALQHLASYFLTLNGITDISDMTDDEKIAFSNYYPLFKSETEKTMQLDKINLMVFYHRTQEIKEEKERETEKIRRQFLEIINERIEKQLRQGVDIHNIDVKKMLS
ncbi:MAG: helix-turn-helix transcriptional regulator [Ruminococcus sp.]|nr:helix-turn-helix transcriptional regulator [Ruminococcus sp.]